MVASPSRAAAFSALSLSTPTFRAGSLPWARGVLAQNRAGMATPTVVLATSPISTVPCNPEHVPSLPRLHLLPWEIGRLNQVLLKVPFVTHVVAFYGVAGLLPAHRSLSERLHLTRVVFSSSAVPNRPCDRLHSACATPPITYTPHIPHAQTAHSLHMHSTHITLTPYTDTYFYVYSMVCVHFSTHLLPGLATFVFVFSCIENSWNRLQM